MTRTCHVGCSTSGQEQPKDVGAYHKQDGARIVDADTIGTTVEEIIVQQCLNGQDQVGKAFPN